LSTSPSQAALAPTWKQEVNRRIAAHKTQKNGSTAPAPAQPAAPATAASRAAQTAARVAARYASVPSFSEMLAEEARGAVRAAEAASRAALEAQAAAESILAELEAASASEARWGTSNFSPAPDHGIELAWKAPVAPINPIAPVASLSAVAPDPEPEMDWESLDRQPVGIRWDADLPVRSLEPVETRATRGPVAYETSAEETWTPEMYPQESPAGESFHVVEPAPPSHANLIEFPRELVATRKVRPRRAEGHAAIAAPSGQLSIFEVDPASISTEPEAPSGFNPTIAPEWQGPVWSGIELDAEPVTESVAESATVVETSALDLAPFGIRSMAAVVDGADFGSGAGGNRSALPCAVLYPGRRYAGYEVCRRLPVHLRRRNADSRAIAEPSGGALAVGFASGSRRGLGHLRRGASDLARPPFPYLPS